MKNILLTLSALSVLTACSSGSSGSAGGVSPVLPTVPSNPITSSQLAAVPLNQLLTSTVCVIENTSSAKYYFTKLPSNQIALEKDSFMGNTTCSANLFSTGKITYSALSFSIFSGDSSFDLLSLSLVSHELTFYNQADIDMFNSSLLFGYQDFSPGISKRIDCRKPDNNINGTQTPCAGTASTEKIRYVNSDLNFGSYLFQ